MELNYYFNETNIVIVSDGKSSWLPQVVLAQKLVNEQDLVEIANKVSSEVISVLSCNPDIDLSVEDL